MTKAKRDPQRVQFEEEALGVSIDVGQVLLADPEFMRKHEAYLASLTPQQRAEYDRNKEQARRICAAEEQAFLAATKERQRVKEEGHRKIESDRKAGLIGTQTELGRPYGLSSIAVGKILDAHGLRERVEVEVEGISGDPRLWTALGRLARAGLRYRTLRACPSRRRAGA